MTVTFTDNWQRYDKHGTDFRLAKVVTFEGEKRASTAFDYFADSFQAGDTIEFELCQKFWGVRLTVGTAVSAGAVTFTWEYYASTAWQPLNVINGNALLSTGVQDVMFVLPEDANGGVMRKFRVRVRIASVTSPAEGGAQAGDYVYFSERACQITGAGDDFDSIYTAEKAAKYTIFSGTPSASITSMLTLPTKEMRAVTRLEFALSASTTAGAGDTIVISGTDQFGNAISETLAITGNGTYNSAASFQTLTGIACNGFTDGTLTVKTLRGCGIEKIGDYSYFLIAHLWVGDGTTVTTFADQRKSVEFAHQVNFFIEANATIQMGELYDYNGTVETGRNGGRWMLRRKYQDAGGESLFVSSDATASFYFYGGVLSMVSAGYDITRPHFYLCNMRLRDVLFTDGGSGSGLEWNLAGGTSYELIRVTMVQPSCGYLGGAGTYQNIIVNGRISWFHVPTQTMSEITLASILFQGSDNSQLLTMKNPIGLLKENWTYNYTDAYSQTEGNKITFSFDLTVIDTSGSPIGSAAVTITDVSGGTIYSGSTDSNGQIPQQELKQWTRDLVSGVVQSWVAHTPHTVTITKSGYRQNIMVLTMDRKREEIAVLVASLPIVEGAITGDVSQDAVTGDIVQDVVTGNVTD